MMKKKIFISYRSIEREKVEKLVKTINNFGEYEIWWDSYLIGGQKWWDTILEEIRVADIVIIMMSTEYLRSEPCKRERKYANDLNKHVIPIRIESDIKANDTGELMEIQYIKFYAGSIDPDKLKEAIELAQPAELPIPLPDPPKAPISPIVDFKIRVSEKALNSDEQHQLVIDLQRYRRRNQGEKKKINSIFKEFIKRDDISKEAYELISEIFSASEPVSGTQETQVISPNRRIEAAMPVCSDANSDSKLKIKISLPDSGGLLDELPEVLPSGHRIQRGDVRHSNATFHFPVDKETGIIKAGNVCVRIEAEHFSIEAISISTGDCSSNQQYELRIPTKADSRTLNFILSPIGTYTGLSTVRIFVYEFGEIVADLDLETEIVSSNTNLPICGDWRLVLLSQKKSASKSLKYISSIVAMFITIIAASAVFPQIGQANRNATTTADTIASIATANVINMDETQTALDTIALQTQAIVEANETQNAIDTLTADTVATQDTINTSETQTAVAQATQDAIINETANAQANLDTVATQDALNTADAVAIFNEQATQAVIGRATADALAIIDANETQNAIGTADAQATIDALAIQNTIGTADAQTTLDALATQAILDALATQNSIATANALATQSANDTATAIAQMTLSAIPTNTATYTPSPTLGPGDWQAIIQQLRGEGIIGLQGQLIFEEDRAFVQGQGSLYQSLASDTFVQNIVLSAEIRLESNSSEIEFCALQIRVQEDSPGIATTTVTVGLINDGRLFVDEFLDEAYISGKVESVSVDIEDNNHLMLVAVDNILTVYLNGEPIVQNHVIDEHDGMAGLSILGQSSDSRCEANNVWAYEVQ